MILKHPETNALLNIDNFETIVPYDVDQFKSKIMMATHTASAGWYATEASVDEIFAFIKTKRFFVMSYWKQMWN